MKVAYIAGPFTAANSWERERNIRRAEEAGFLVSGYGAMPLIPHANTRHFEGTRSPEFWYAGTIELLRRCDAVVVIKGWENSVGTLAEIEEAKRSGLRVFYPAQMDQGGDLNEFASWVRP